MRGIQRTDAALGQLLDQHEVGRELRHGEAGLGEEGGPRGVGGEEERPDVRVVGRHTVQARRREDSQRHCARGEA